MVPRHSCCLLVLTVLLLDLLCLTSGSFSTTSGPPPPLTEEQKRRVTEALESSLLTMFGFSRRPQPLADVHVPQYMIDLYRQSSGDVDTDIPSVFTRRQGSVRSNTVRSFFHEGRISSLYTVPLFPLS